ncbi:MAG: hypothetical protein ACEPOZ_04415 [Marinifilaceae bacterium]
MEILLTASSFYEIQALVGEMELVENLGNNYARFRFHNQEIDVLISGIGSGIASYHLTRALMTKSYDRVLGTGLCYALPEKLESGSLVHVIDDQYGDLGYWGDDGFQTLFDLRVIRQDEFPFHRGILENNESFSPTVNELPKVTGITLNSISGEVLGLERMFHKYLADVVSMDGAASFYCCMNEKLPCFQVRVVTNNPKELIKPASIDSCFSNDLCDRLRQILEEWNAEDES